MAERWTIYVCRDCRGGLCSAPNSGDLSCDCPDDPNGEDRDYAPIDKPVEVMPAEALDDLHHKCESLFEAGLQVLHERDRERATVRRLEDALAGARP